MRRAIVHIGLPRTGTTTFQHVLSALRESLAERGVLYPDLRPQSASVSHLSHQYLGEALDGRRTRAERNELLGQLAGMLRRTDADTVLLSYEGLCRRPPLLALQPVAQMLCDLFAANGFTMETLFTVKPQAEYLNSLYTLRTQWLLEARSFGDFVQAQLGTPALDYAAMLRPWRRACAGRTHLVPLRDRVSADLLIPRIFAAIGLADRIGDLLDRADLPRHDNASPGPVAVEVARRLRAIGVARRPGGSIRDITRFIQEISDDRQGFNGLTDDLRARVEAEYTAANDAMARQCWHTGWAARVADAPVQAANEIAGRAIAQNTEHALRGLLQDTCSRFGLRHTGVMDGLREAPTALRNALLGRRRALS